MKQSNYENLYKRTAEQFILKFNDIHAYKAAEKMHYCANHQNMKNYFQCKNKFCIYCNNNQKKILYSKINNAINTIINDGYQFEAYFLTLTFNDMKIENMKKQIQKAKKALNQFTKIISKNFNLIGYFNSYDISSKKSYSETSNINYHYHSVVLIEKHPTFAKDIKLIWESIPEHENFNTREVFVEHIDTDDRAIDIACIASYATKHLSFTRKLSPQNFRYIHEALQNIHRFSSGGLIRKTLNENQAKFKALQKSKKQDELNKILSGIISNLQSKRLNIVLSDFNIKNMWLNEIIYN